MANKYSEIIERGEGRMTTGIGLENCIKRHRVKIKELELMLEEQQKLLTEDYILLKDEIKSQKRKVRMKQ